MTPWPSANQNAALSLFPAETEKSVFSTLRDATSRHRRHHSGSYVVIEAARTRGFHPLHRGRARRRFETDKICSKTRSGVSSRTDESPNATKRRLSATATGGFGVVRTAGRASGRAEKVACPRSGRYRDNDASLLSLVWSTAGGGARVRRGVSRLRCRDLTFIRDGWPLAGRRDDVHRAERARNWSRFIEGNA